jgi:hypothetical protein
MNQMTPKGKVIIFYSYVLSLNLDENFMGIADLLLPCACFLGDFLKFSKLISSQKEQSTDR